MSHTGRTTLLLLVVVSFGLCATRAQADGTTGAMTLQRDPDILRELGVPEGYVLVEGDIQVPASFVDGAAEGLNRSTFTTILWDEGTIPFEFDPIFAAFPARQATCEQAMADIEAASTVNFRPRVGTDVAWVRFAFASGNNAPVGWGLGERRVNLTDFFVGVVTHELLHVAGFWHEQSRSDRDAYVTIEYDNIDDTGCGGEPCDYNFDLAFGARDYGPYDFGSIMHYGACDFSSCDPCSASDADCRTITVNPLYAAQWQTAIGQIAAMSYWDATTLGFLYPQSDWRFVDGNSSSLFESGTFLDPYKTLTPSLTVTPPGGTVWIEPGSYQTPVILDSRLTLRAAQGGVVLAP